jgi:MFS family permease
MTAASRAHITARELTHHLNLTRRGAAWSSSGHGRGDGRVRSRASVVAACLVCQMGLGLGGYVFAVFLKPIVAELGWSRTAFAGSGGPFLLAMALASPIAAPPPSASVRASSSRRAITVVAGALVGLSYMTALWHFYVLGLVLGAATTGLGDIPVGAVVRALRPRRRGLALGLVYVGSNIGGTIVPIAASTIAEAWSWRTALRVLAVAGWLVIFPFARWGVPGERRRGDGRRRRPTDGMTLGDAMRTTAFWALAVVLFAFYFYYLGVNNHLVASCPTPGSRRPRRRVGSVGRSRSGSPASSSSGVSPTRSRCARSHSARSRSSRPRRGCFSPSDACPRSSRSSSRCMGSRWRRRNVVLPLAVVARFGPPHLGRIYGALMLVLLPGGVLGPLFAAWMFDTGRGYWNAFAVFAAGNALAVALVSRLALGRSDHQAAVR